MDRRYYLARVRNKVDLEDVFMRIVKDSKNGN